MRGDTILDRLWRINMFGGLSARRGEQIIERFRTRHAASLLAYLAYRPGVATTRDELAEMLWPGADPDFQKRNLRQALFYLRRHLNDPELPVADSILIPRVAPWRVPALL